MKLRVYLTLIASVFSATCYADFKDDVQENRIDKVKSYLSDKPDLVKNYNKKKVQLLNRSVSRGNIEMVKLLLEHGADPNILHYKNGSLPLNEAAVQGNIDIIKLLLKFGAKVNARDSSRWKNTALHRAVGSNQVDVIKYLISLKNKNKMRIIDIDTTSSNGSCLSTALHGANDAKREEIAIILLKAGARMDLLYKFTGEFPIHAAARNNYANAFALMVKKGVDLKRKMKRPSHLKKNQKWHTKCLYELTLSPKTLAILVSKNIKPTSKGLKRVHMYARDTKGLRPFIAKIKALMTVDEIKKADLEDSSY